MKKTTKILLGLLIATGILHLSLMYIPQFFSTDYISHDMELTTIGPNEGSTTMSKTIKDPFKHVVFTNDSSYYNNGIVFINRKSDNNIKHTTITCPNALAKLYSVKVANDTLYITMSKPTDKQLNETYSEDQCITSYSEIQIEMPGNLESITNASNFNIDIYNFEVDSFNIISPSHIITANNETKPNPFSPEFRMGIYRCKIKQLNNYSEAGIDVEESEIENLHQNRNTWSTNKGAELHMYNKLYSYDKELNMCE